MDVVTKEAVLKLAGYELWEVKGVMGNSYRIYREENNDILSHAIDKKHAINVAYNTFLTRQNETS